MSVFISIVKHTRFVWLLLSLLLLEACQSHVWQRSAFAPCRLRVQSGECWRAPDKAPQDADLIAVAYAATDSLLQSLRTPLNKAEGIIITTLVDLNDLHQSSDLGRLLSEHIAARFTQQGYTVLEARLQKDLLYKERDGEFVLSRLVSELRKTHPVANLTLGTYSIAEDQVYFNIKLVNEHSIALASHSFSLPLGKNTLSLLLD